MLISATSVMARGTYQAPSDFISDAFDGSPPKVQTLWITKNIRHEVEEILGHDFRGMRTRYWAQGQRSAWILEEIGKEKPITTGIIVNQGKIEQLRVLIFREERGSEVRYPFFYQQFDGATLVDEHQLDRHIDGISGATLSVRALKKLSRLALFLDQYTHFQDAGTTHVTP